MTFLRRSFCFLLLVVSAGSLGTAQQSATWSEPPAMFFQDEVLQPGLHSLQTDSLQQQSPNAQPASPQSTPAPAANPNGQTTGSQQPVSPSATEPEKEIQKKEQSQRILGVVPQFDVTSRQNAPPLTTGQKFHLFAKSSFDPVQYPVAGLQAALSQATDEFPGYGQGAAGYGKRFGAAFADQVSSNFFSNFVYPTLLKEDPRYFRLGEGSIKHRILYSLEQEFVCHTDKGGRSFNWSNAFGAFTTGGLSNAYYPQSDRGVGLTMSRSGVSLLYGSLGGLIDEFWIDIDHKLFHKHPKQPKDTNSKTRPQN